MRRGLWSSVDRRTAGPCRRRRRAPQDTVRIGVLKFGTVNWEIDTIVHNKLDEANGFKLEPVVLASNDATRIAINAGEVDVIVSDWLFVSRQRAEGLPLTFVPFSTSVGAIMVPPDSTAQTLADLKGAKIGVAGGPLDKNWLMYQGLAKDKYGFDLAGRDRTGLRRAAASHGEADAGRARRHVELLELQRQARGAGLSASW